MAISAVMVANMFAGLSTTAWSGWIFFAVFIGIIIIWVFTVNGVVKLSVHFVSPKSIGNRQQLINVYYVWEQPFALPFGLFLALPASNIHTCHDTTLSIQGMAIRLPTK